MARLLHGATDQSRSRAVAPLISCGDIRCAVNQSAPLISRALISAALNPAPAMGRSRPDSNQGPGLAVEV